LVGWLKFIVPFWHKYGYIRDDIIKEEPVELTQVYMANGGWNAVIINVNPEFTQPIIAKCLMHCTHYHYYNRFTALFSGTTRMSRCQNRTTVTYGARED